MIRRCRWGSFVVVLWSIFVRADLLRNIQDIKMDIDMYYHADELEKARHRDSRHAIDSCQVGMKGHENFGDIIALQVESHMTPRRSPIDYVYDVFDLPKSHDNYFPVSLWSHPICKMTTESFAKIMTNRKQPSAEVVLLVNRWVAKYNRLRCQAISQDKNGSKLAILQIERLWTKLFYCLSFAESLQDPDNPSSKKVAQEVSPADYERPEGVAFYMDPRQTDPESTLNIGLYQFGVYSGGDTQACIREWNRLYKTEKSTTCGISQKASKEQMVFTSGSSLQAFNAFCGVNQILQNFTVQVNSKNPRRTHPDNLVKGMVKPPQDRCVSLHFSTKWSYAHFGPLQNVLGTTLGRLMTCSLNP